MKCHNRIWTHGPARLWVGTLTVCAGLVLAEGCPTDRGQPPPGTTEASFDADPTADAPAENAAETSGEPGVVKGRAVFKGALPEPRKIVATKDVEYCGKFDGQRQEVTVSDSGGLEGVVVELRGLEEPEGGWDWQHPADGYVIRQKGCAFEPAILVVPNGQELRVFNDDPVSHNINTGLWNILQASGESEPLVRPLSGLRPIRVGCNIHSWMESWIYLAQSPFFAVTDQDGAFRIEGVPPGRYRLLAWHPSLRQQRVRLEVPAGESVAREFVFESPF